MATNKVLIDVKERGSKKAAGKLKNLGASLKGVIGPAAALGAAYFGSKALINGMTESVRLAGEQEVAEKKLETVLKSTGHAAGATAEEMKKLAKELAAQTTFTDQAIIGAESLMLTFTQVSNEVMPDAIETILNMSEALGTNLKEQTIQLGKALNDPIKGVSALADVGVSLSEEQKNLVQSFMDVGDVAGAQKVILDELAVEFGGMAKAAGETVPGKLKTMNNAIGEAGEVLGGMLAPLVTWGATMVTSAAEGVGAFMKELQTIDLNATMEAMFSDFEGWIDLYVDLFKIWWNSLPILASNAWDAVGENVMDFFSSLQDAVFQLGAFLWEPIPIGFNIAVTKIQIFFTELWQNIKNIGIDGINGLMGVINDAIAASPKLSEMLGFEEMPLLAKTSAEEASSALTEQLTGLQEELAETGMAKLLSDIFTVTEDDAQNVDGMLAQMGAKIDAFMAERVKKKKDADAEELKSDNDKTNKIINNQKKTGDAAQEINDSIVSGTASSVASQISMMQTAGMATSKQAKEAAKTAATVDAIRGAAKAYSEWASIPPLAVAAAGVALAAGYARVQQIERAQEGYSGVVTQPTMFLAGESGAEQVNVTNLDVPGGGINSGGGQNITVNVSGNVLTTDFVEGELAEAIEDAMRRGQPPYSSINA